MAVEFGFKKRNRMCQLHINRGVSSSGAWADRAGGWATERATMGQRSVLCLIIGHENSVQPKFWGMSGAMPCAEDPKTIRLESCLQATEGPVKRKNTCVKPLEGASLFVEVKDFIPDIK